jgi:hypothetical protein
MSGIAFSPRPPGLIMTRSSTAISSWISSREPCRCGVVKDDDQLQIAQGAPDVLSAPVLVNMLLERQHPVLGCAVAALQPGHRAHSTVYTLCVAFKALRSLGQWTVAPPMTVGITHSLRP